MLPKSSTQRSPSVSPRQSGSGLQASAPERPVPTNNEKLKLLLDKLDKPGQSPQQRFQDWTKALTKSMGDEGCLKWLALLHAQGANGSNEFDACIALDELALDTLERAFDWLDRNRISLPVDIVMTSDEVRDGDEMLQFASLMLRESHLIRSLHMIDISNAFIEGAVSCLVQLLEGNQSLRSLELTNCGLDDQNMPLIAQALKGNRSIEKLDISHNPCGAVGLTALGKAISHNRRLRSLTLSGLGKFGGLAAIFDSMPGSVQELHLASGSFGAADAKALANLLGRAPLKVLNLAFPRWNGHRDDEMRSPSRRLQNKLWHGFQKVSLSRKKRGDKKSEAIEARITTLAKEGADLIFDAIAKNSTLRTIHIQKWVLDKQHVDCIGRALKNPQCHLREMMMSSIDDLEMQQVLANAAEINKTLITVNKRPTGENFLDEYTQRNRDNLAEKTRGAMDRIILNSNNQLIPLPSDVLAYLGEFLDLDAQENVIDAANGLP